MSLRLVALASVASLVLACSPGQEPPAEDGQGSGAEGAGAASAGGGGIGGSTGTLSDPTGGGGPGVECQPCSEDFTQVLDCDGNVVETCPPDQLCGSPGQCMAPCDAAAANKSSVGCDYYAVTLNAMGGAFGGCFVSFVANTSNQPTTIQASWGDLPIDLAVHAAIPVGSGPSLTYEPYDPAAGLAPGQVAILFLANDPGPHGNWSPAAACPVPAAVGLDAHVHYGLNISTGRSQGFHITTDQPVVAYQMLPYNAAYAAATGATLLIPTSAWDTNYVAVNAYRAADWQGLPLPPSMTIVAKEDGTTVTILPKVNIKEGINVQGAVANQPMGYVLHAGDTIEFIQAEELTGSPIQSDKPIGVFAGHLGLRIPYNVDYSDHAEQQIPPVRALGHEYAVVSYRDRVEGVTENRMHRVVGAVDGTTLSYEPPIPGAPTSLNLGDVFEFHTDEPFIVRSQSSDHPFMVFTYMSGSANLADLGAPSGYGDTDFVRIVAGEQFLRRYVFFTDPTYPETNLVVVRKKGDDGFADVTLDCRGTIDGWLPVGDGATYEYTRVDVSRHNFEGQDGCDNGRREMESDGKFGVWVWGWGTPETRAGEDYPCDITQPNNSCDVSYAYPAGENVIPINTVVVPPVPR